MGGGTFLEVGILAKHLARYGGMVAVFFFCETLFCCICRGRLKGVLCCMPAAFVCEGHRQGTFFWISTRCVYRGVFFAEVASAVCVGARLWILFLQYQG